MEVTLHEVGRQEYGGNGAVFSAGFADGHPIDTVYLQLERPGEGPTCLLLRPDEMAIIAWLCSGVLWSHLLPVIEPELQEVNDDGD